MSEPSTGFRLDGGGEILVFLTPGEHSPELANWRPSVEAGADRFIPPGRPPPTFANTPFLARGEPIRASSAVLAQNGLPLPILTAGEIAAWLSTRVDT